MKIDLIGCSVYCDGEPLDNIIIRAHPWFAGMKMGVLDVDALTLHVPPAFFSLLKTAVDVQEIGTLLESLTAVGISGLGSKLGASKSPA